MKTALILGITGQDGSYLAEHLLNLGYEVHGFVRHTDSDHLRRISHIAQKLTLTYGEITDQESLDNAIKLSQPDEVYNFASQSFIPLSWDKPVLTTDVNGTAVVRILEALRRHKPDTKFYQASSSEMYGDPLEVPQNENTPFVPRNPYGVAKVLAHHTVSNYRQHYGLFACSGICFNHESPRRGMEFVTRRLAHGVARIKLGRDRELKVGNLNSKRDWGYAPEYVEAMWLMLQQDEPDDYVIATGQSHSVKEFVMSAFNSVGLDWRSHVVVDQELYRPSEDKLLVGDASRAKNRLGWNPKTSFESLVELMVNAELECLKRV